MILIAQPDNSLYELFRPNELLQEEKVNSMQSFCKKRYSRTIPIYENVDDDLKMIWNKIFKVQPDHILIDNVTFSLINDLPFKEKKNPTTPRCNYVFKLDD